jgi:hypothetical protein
VVEPESEIGVHFITRTGKQCQVNNDWKAGHKARCGELCAANAAVDELRKLENLSPADFGRVFDLLVDCYIGGQPPLASNKHFFHALALVSAHSGCGKIPLLLALGTWVAGYMQWFQAHPERFSAPEFAEARESVIELAFFCTIARMEQGEVPVDKGSTALQYLTFCVLSDYEAQPGARKYSGASMADQMIIAGMSYFGSEGQIDEVGVQLASCDAWFRKRLNALCNGSYFTVVLSITELQLVLA